MATGTDAPLLGEPVPVELMNTVWADRSAVHDALADDGGAAAWLAALRPRLDLQDPRIAAWLAAPPAAELADAVRDLRSLRDAVRRLAAEQTGDPRTRVDSATGDLATAVAAVNAAAARGPRWQRLHWDAGPASEPRTAAEPGVALLATFADAAITFFAGEARHDLRACLAPGCVLYFVRQHTRREWCSTGCGNRVRAARHYERRRGL